MKASVQLWICITKSGTISIFERASAENDKNIALMRSNVDEIALNSIYKSIVALKHSTFTDFQRRVLRVYNNNV